MPRIAIVDDHALFREGIAGLLTTYPDLDVIFTARNDLEMMGCLEKGLVPDIMLLDINMPEADGYLLAKWLNRKYPEVKVIALSMLEDEHSVIRMIQNGAVGFICKGCSPDELHEAIQSVNENGYYHNELLPAKLRKSVQQGVLSAPILSPKELEFIRYCCTSDGYELIASKMEISVNTLDKHRASVFNKLDLNSRSGLVIYAVKNGLVFLQG